MRYLVILILFLGACVRPTIDDVIISVEYDEYEDTRNRCVYLIEGERGSKNEIKAPCDVFKIGDRLSDYIDFTKKKTTILKEDSIKTRTMQVIDSLLKTIE